MRCLAVLLYLLIAGTALAQDNKAQQDASDNQQQLKAPSVQHATQWLVRQQQIEREQGRQWLREHPEQADPQQELERQERLAR